MLTQKPGISDWVEKAVSFPLAFAQTREDPLLDRLVVKMLPANCRVAMIASGGCTASYLASLPQIAALNLVDPNRAQLSLTKLKVHLLCQEDPITRLEILGHRGSAENRKTNLTRIFKELGLQADCLGSWEMVTSKGPDFAGRYEACFQALVEELQPYQGELADLLGRAETVPSDYPFPADTPLWANLDKALEKVLSLPNLIALFGEGATRNPVEPFSRHFAKRIRHALTHFPPRSNTFLWQMLAGCYPPETRAEWQTITGPKHLPSLSFHQAFMDDFLQGTQSENFDLVHLSNILDWLTPEQGKRTLELAHRALKPGGLVFIRQLNSTLEIPSLCGDFDWLREEGASLLARDRSFFYRELHLGKKRCA